MKRLLVLLLTILALNGCEEDTTIIDATTADKKMDKVDVCHYDADTDTWETININENALKAHLAHGDYRGECDDLYTYVPDDAFEDHLIRLGHDIDKDNYVLTSNISGVKELVIQGGFAPGVNRIKNLTGLEDFSSLEYLDLAGNLVSSYDFSANTQLKHLAIGQNELKSLNVTNNKALTFLNFGQNQVATIDLIQNTALEVLLCGYNQLTSLNISNNIALKRLACYYNQLTSLDVSKNTVLEEFSCLNNQLTKLDVSKNIALGDFRCDGNLLTSLDVSKNINLYYLYCKNNLLKSLDVTQNVALQHLDCKSNELTSLNMKNGNNLLIWAFWADDNPNLDCIQVDNPTWSNNNLSWTKDATAIYSVNCTP